MNRAPTKGDQADNSSSMDSYNQDKQHKRINEAVSLITSANWITVRVNDQPVMGYEPGDKSTRNSVVVQLLEAQLLTLSEGVKGFGIARSTLRGVLKAFRQEGIRGLVPAKSGPKEAWKLIPRARRLLLDVVYSHPDWNMPQIMTKVNQQLELEGLAPLSRRHARRFLTSCGVSTVTTNSTGFATGQLSAQKDNQPEISDLNSQEQPLVVKAPSCYQPQTTLTTADRRYLSQLEKGIDSAFAGGFLTVPFLTLIQFPKLINDQLNVMAEGYISTQQVVLNYFYLALFGIASLEMVKMIIKTELGLLIGRSRSCGLTKLRSFLSELAKYSRAEAFALAAACHQIQAGVVEWQVLFVDGHFIPYYGRRSIRKGYFTTRRMALKGNEAYYANDRQGRPLFFLLTEASTSLIAILPEIVARVRQIVDQKWTDWCLTLAFDRGGFCAQLFKKLDQSKVYWVTWLKISRKVRTQVYQIEEESFRLYLLRLKKSRVKVKLYEWKVEITAYGLCRAIILHDPKTQKRMVIISNDKKRSCDEIAELLIARWSQENFFKVMQARYHLDYCPSYQFEEVEQEALVDNPHIKQLRAQKRRLQAQKRKLESELSQKLLARKRDNVSLQSYKEAHQKRVRTIEALTGEIERIKEELTQTPKQIPLSQAWGRKHNITILEGKGFFDVIKGVAFNAEEWLLEQLKPHYQAQNIRQILLGIINRGGIVQLIDGVIHVRLKPFDSFKAQAAASALCESLNQEPVCTLDKFQLPLMFEVFPQT